MAATKELSSFRIGSFFLGFLLFFQYRLSVVSSKNFDPCKSSVDSDKKTVSNTKINAILWAQRPGEVFIFNDAYFWHYNYVSSQLGPMQSIKDYWPEVTTPIDSVTDFENETVKSILFFQGYKYWIYKTKKLTDKAQKLVTEGTFASIEVKTVDAIQIITIKPDTALEDQMGILCTGGNIYLCNVKIADNMLIDGCTAFNKYKDLLSGEACDGFAKFDSKSLFIGSGQKIVVYANDTHKYGSRSIKDQIYKCKPPSMSKSTYAVMGGCGVVSMGIVFVILGVIIHKVTAKKENDEDEEDDEEPESVVKPAPKSVKTVKKLKVSKK